MLIAHRGTQSRTGVAARGARLMIGSGAMDVVLDALVDVLVFLALVTVGLVLLAVVARRR